MKILAIETTGLFASVAVIDENQNIWDAQSDRKLSHLENLVPMIEKLLENCELKLGDMTHIAVSEGPGSFTGIRIGMATAKALAQALDLPMISVPTLKSFAWNVPDFDGLICPVFDARREQIYAGAYYWQEESCYQAIPDRAYYGQDFLAKIDTFDPDKKRKIMLLGDGIDIISEVVDAWEIRTNRKSLKGDSSVILAQDNFKLQKASSVAKLAYILYEEGNVKNFADLQPVYLRKPEAERRLEERLSKENIR